MSENLKVIAMICFTVFACLWLMTSCEEARYESNKEVLIKSGAMGK